MIHDISKGCADRYPVHNTYRFTDTETGYAIVICDPDFEIVIEKNKAPESGWKGFLLRYHCIMSHSRIIGGYDEQERTNSIIF